MKKYEMSFSVQITDQSVSYDTKPVVKISVSERLPVDVDPELYIRQRLAEEVKRQFKNLTEEIENKSEDYDPLQGETV
jgi:hypothetical protein